MVLNVPVCFCLFRRILFTDNCDEIINALIFIMVQMKEWTEHPPFHHHAFILSYSKILSSKGFSWIRKQSLFLYIAFKTTLYCCMLTWTCLLTWTYMNSYLQLANKQWNTFKLYPATHVKARSGIVWKTFPISCRT